MVRQDRENLLQKCTELDAKYQDLYRDRGQSTSALEVANSQMQEKLASLQATNQLLSTKLREAECNADAFRRDLLAAQSKLQSESASLARLQQLLEDSVQDAHTKATERDVTLRQLHRAVDLQKALQEQLAVVTNALNGQQSQLEQSRLRIRDLTAELESYRTGVEQLRSGHASALEEAQKRLTQAQAELSSAEQRIAFLEDALEKSRRMWQSETANSSAHYELQA